jgi:hypothetical protein
MPSVGHKYQKRGNMMICSSSQNNFLPLFQKGLYLAGNYRLTPLIHVDKAAKLNMQHLTFYPVKFLCLSLQHVTRIVVVLNHWDGASC